MGASKRMMLAKAMKAARAAKVDAPRAPSAIAADLTVEPPLGPSSPPPQSQIPGSPPPIAAVPLAVAASPSPTPLDKGKRVLEVLSDDEDSDGGLVFKRRRAARVPTPPAASPQGGSSLRDNPPSASSPIPAMVQGEKGDDVGAAPTPTSAGTFVAPATPVAAPDIISMPPPIMHFLRGFNGEAMLETPDRREGMPFYMGAFLAVALDWRTQARNAALQTHKVQALEAKVSALEQDNENLRRKDEASRASLKLAETAKEEIEKQLAEATDLQDDFYTREVALQV